MTLAGRIDMPDESWDGIDKGRRLIRLDDGGLSLSERLATRFRHMIWRTPLHRLRLRGKFPLKLLSVPGDPIPGDRTRGSALLEGRALYHGQEISLADLDFATLNVSPGLADYLQSFEWLRDLASAGPREETAPIAEKLMRNWLETHSGKVAEAGWRTDVGSSHLPLDKLCTPDPVFGRSRISICGSQHPGARCAPSRSRCLQRVAGPDPGPCLGRADRRRLARAGRGTTGCARRGRSRTVAFADPDRRWRNHLPISGGAACACRDTGDAPLRL